MPRGEIRHLKPWLNEPYQHDRVMAAARNIGQPFVLREVVAETGLPTPVVHRVLSRAVKAGLLTRAPALITYPTVTGGQGGDPSKVRWIPGGRKRRVYLYSFVEGR
jgi:hypothetical protein